MNVALIHYCFVSWRGGEKVSLAISKLFDRCDLYTLYYDREACGPYLGNRPVTTSMLNRFSLLRKHYKKTFFLFPLAIRSLKLAENKYDLVISIEDGPTKGIKVPGKVPHLCYCHSPMRYAWGMTATYARSLPLPLRPLFHFSMFLLRLWDKTTVDNVDRYIASTHNAARRIKKYYNKDAKVIYPPVYVDSFVSLFHERQNRSFEFYLVLGALIPYKRVDIAVEAFTMNKKRLVIVGEGELRSKLEKRAGPNIEFRGYLDETELATYITRTRALIFPGEEDFGLVPVEVMAAGIPVIAYAAGGATETVISDVNDMAGSTGLFFYEQTARSLAKAVDTFEKNEHLFDPEFISKRAEKFAPERFIQAFMNEITDFVGHSAETHHELSQL